MTPSQRISFIYAALILSLETISFRATNNMVLTTVPLLVKYTLGFSNSLIGILAASLTIAMLASTIFINTRLNAKTRRTAFIASSFFIPASLVFYHYSSAITVWLISVASGISYGMIIPNIVTSASVMATNKRMAEQLLGLYSTSLSLSLIIGPIIETYLLNYFTYRQIFLFFIPLALLESILSLFIKFPEVKVEFNGKAELKNRGLISAVLSITTYNVPFAALTAFLAIYARERFLTTASLAYFSFIPFYIASFMTRSMMTIKPFRNLIKPMFYSVMLTIIGLLGIVLSPTYFMFIIFLILLGIPHGSVYPMSTIMIARYTRLEERNTINSYFSSYTSILGILVPPIFGIISSISNLELAFAVLVVPVAISAFLFFKMFLKDPIITGNQT